MRCASSDSVTFLFSCLAGPGNRRARAEPAGRCGRAAKWAKKYQGQPPPWEFYCSLSAAYCDAVLFVAEDQIVDIDIHFVHCVISFLYDSCYYTTGERKCQAKNSTSPIIWFAMNQNGAFSRRDAILPRGTGRKICRWTEGAGRRFRREHAAAALVFLQKNQKPTCNLAQSPLY